MSRPATTRLKVNPPLGTLPVLQYCAPDQLKIDEEYQRTLSAGASQALIRRIAMHWDWGLCQPLFVARRGDGGLYVVDGQHRLEAARLRGDIWQLPCVVTSFATMADEAAAFVSLNQQRRPLTALEVFKAAIAAGDQESSEISSAIATSGLRLASTTNNVNVAPGSIANIGGLKHCYRVHGQQTLIAALWVMGCSYRGEVLRYAGTLFPGIAAITAAEIRADAEFGKTAGPRLMVALVSSRTQIEWVAEINALIAKHTTTAMNRRNGSIAVFEAAWTECQDGFDVEAA